MATSIKLNPPPYRDHAKHCHAGLYKSPPSCYSCGMKKSPAIISRFRPGRVSPQLQRRLSGRSAGPRALRVRHASAPLWFEAGARFAMRRYAAPIVIALLASLAAACARPTNHAPEQKPTPGYSLNPALLDLPKRRWIKIHRQHSDDAVTFVRQEHGGSAFDSHRGRLVLFGSDTHVKRDWTNSPLFFDLQQLEWRRL